MTLRSSWRRGAALFLALSTLVTAGCASARMVYREPERGELALTRDTPRARRLAATEMSAHCGADGYRIVREENVVVGETTQSYGQAQTNQSSNQSANQSGSHMFMQSETMPVHELHVTYECGSLALAAE